MKRGEIWTVAGGAAYAGRPRAAVIVHNDRFDADNSIVVCPLTTDPTPAPIFRLSVQASSETRLRAPYRMMVNKLTAVPEETPQKAGRLTGLRRNEGAQSHHFRIPGFGRNGSVARLASSRARSLSNRLSHAAIWFPTAKRSDGARPAPLVAAAWRCGALRPTDRSGGPSSNPAACARRPAGPSTDPCV
jgi:mRNA interferase MazF